MVNEDVELLATEAAEAYHEDDFDRAVFLLKQIKARGQESSYVDVDAMLQEAEAALVRQVMLRDAEIEYQEIAALVLEETTRSYGCQVFNVFRSDYPDYDPANLASFCGAADPLDIDWCEIPGGAVTLRRDERVTVHQVEYFAMSRYPVTNAQWLAFVDAPDGYANTFWWDYSQPAREWRRGHRTPFVAAEGLADHPCVNVNWFEAVAYCRWLSYRTELQIMLPTERQWQRAAQGDDGRRFPWGNQFDAQYCNTKECGLHQTVPVTQFPAGASPYGVMDMVGNVWEWCVNGGHALDDLAASSQRQQIIKGGSFIRSRAQAQCQRYYVLGPHNCHEFDWLPSGLAGLLGWAVIVICCRSPYTQSRA